ncbi:MAG: hypothetical protein PHR60_02070 [Eubacteriales bacterium]|nr:hypothetical protein [Eubacteriales bacterium]
MCTKVRNEKKGSVILEASLILPLFLLAMLSLICLIRMVGIEENVMHVYSREAVKIGKEAYVETAGDWITGAIFSIRIHDQIEKTENKSISGLQLKNFKYLYENEGLSDLICGDLSYNITIPLPLKFGRVLEFEDRLVFRGFVGSDNIYGHMDFSRMEQEEEEGLVYVFPRAGEKYHKVNCSYIVVCPREVLLSAQVKKRYTPCRFCRPDELCNGSKVYCFEKAGTAYHRGSCIFVERYVILIEKEKAIEEGYTPCKKCGG